MTAGKGVNRSRRLWWAITNPIYRFVCPYPAERMAGEILARRVLRSRFMAVSLIMQFRAQGMFITEALRMLLDNIGMLTFAFAHLHHTRRVLSGVGSGNQDASAERADTTHRSAAP